MSQLRSKWLMNVSIYKKGLRVIKKYQISPFVRWSLLPVFEGFLVFGTLISLCLYFGCGSCLQSIQCAAWFSETHRLDDFLWGQYVSFARVFSFLACFWLMSRTIFCWPCYLGTFSALWTSCRWKVASCSFPSLSHKSCLFLNENYELF